MLKVRFTDLDGHVTVFNPAPHHRLANESLEDFMARMAHDNVVPGQKFDVVDDAFISVPLSQQRIYAAQALAQSLAVARRQIQKSNVRTKVAHAAVNGDTVAREKLELEAKYRAMTWQQLADEIIQQEHDEERRSFALSGIEAAGKAALQSAQTDTAIAIALKDWTTQIATVVAA
jgi:hypothetical protein